MKDSHPLPSIDLALPLKLQNDPAYREEFFLAEASAEIARQLIALRKRRGLSQSELANLAGTQQPAVSRAEQADYNNWSFNTLRKLTSAMQGRLRVHIEPWEDIISEYYPERFTEEAETHAEIEHANEGRTSAIEYGRPSAASQNRPRSRGFSLARFPMEESLPRAARHERLTYGPSRI